MNKYEFMYILDREIKSLPEADRAEILNDYEEHFRIGTEKGKTDQEICMHLGDPEELAKSFFENQDQSDFKSTPQSETQESTDYSQTNSKSNPQSDSQGHTDYSQGYTNSNPQSDSQGHTDYSQGYANSNPQSDSQGHTDYSQGYANSNPQSDWKDYSAPEYQNAYNQSGNDDGQLTKILKAIGGICIMVFAGVPLIGIIFSLCVALACVSLSFALAAIAMFASVFYVINTGWLIAGLILLGIAFFAISWLLLIATIRAFKGSANLIKTMFNSCISLID